MLFSYLVALATVGPAAVVFAVPSPVREQPSSEHDGNHKEILAARSPILPAVLPALPWLTASAVPLIQAAIVALGVGTVWKVLHETGAEGAAITKLTEMASGMGINLNNAASESELTPANPLTPAERGIVDAQWVLADELRSIKELMNGGGGGGDKDPKDPKKGDLVKKAFYASAGLLATKEVMDVASAAMINIIREAVQIPITDEKAKRLEDLANKYPGVNEKIAELERSGKSEEEILKTIETDLINLRASQIDALEKLKAKQQGNGNNDDGKTESTDAVCQRVRAMMKNEL